MDDPNLSVDSIIEMLLYALELRNSESLNHSLRVAELSLKIGRRMMLGEQDLIVLKRGALLHDIGRIGVPDKILIKVESLESDEWEIIRRHPEYGAKLLKKVPVLQDTIQVVAFHHERWDGMGYPARLQGEKIPLLARICAVAEVFDSMITDQPYRKAWAPGKALLAIEQDVFKAFDAAVVKELAKVIELGE